MPDNTTLNSGTGGDVISTDELTTLNGAAVSGQKVQRVKVGFGSDGSLRDVDSANPLPVTNGQSQPLTNTELRASSVPVLNAAGTNAIGHINELRAATLAVTATGAAAAAVTLTIPAAGVGLFHYITFIEVRLYSTAARTGVAAPILVTTTNIPGTPTLTFDTAGAIGTSVAQQPFVVGQPLKTLTANTAATIVAPAVTGGLWRITATYFIA